MTRVYQSPDQAQGLRVLLVGAGSYPFVKSAVRGVPFLADLTSVAPSILTLLKRLLVDWRTSLGMPLVSIDLLLSDPGQPSGARWPGYGVRGEVAAGTLIDPPTVESVDRGLQAALAGAEANEGLLLFFCGHGFSRTDRYFLLSDFGCGGNPWSRAINLDQLDLGLWQEKPRTLWLFWDCCSDIPSEVLDTLGTVGTTLIQPRASALATANANYGNLSRFGAASSQLGLQAHGTPNGLSRFTEMLLEALNGAGATKRDNQIWWVDHTGIQDALQSYVLRYPDLDKPGDYLFVTPFSSASLQRMRFRKLDSPPSSFLIARSEPRRGALKQAKLCVLPDGMLDDEHAVPGFGPSQPASAIVCFKLPPRVTYTVKAAFVGGEQTKSCFADLPLAEPAIFDAP